MVMVPPCSFNLLCVQQSNHIWVALRPGATPLLQRSWRMPQGCSYRGRVHSICQLVHVVSWSDNRGVTGTFLSNYLIKTVRFHYQFNLSLRLTSIQLYKYYMCIFLNSIQSKSPSNIAYCTPDSMFTICSHLCPGPLVIVLCAVIGLGSGFMAITPLIFLIIWTCY